MGGGTAETVGDVVADVGGVDCDWFYSGRFHAAGGRRLCLVVQS